MFSASRDFFAALAVAATFFFPAAGFADNATDEAAILEIWSNYSAARVAGDSEAWLALWDTEGLRMVPGMPAADFGTFSKGIPAAFAKSKPASMKIEANEVVIMGDWAFSTGNFSVGEQVEGKFLTVLRRQIDGTWRIYRDAFNMNKS